MALVFSKKPKKRVDVPLISLIDIVFLLLVYFLLTTNFMVDEGIPVNLPEVAAAASQTEKDIVVTIGKEGKSFVGSEQVPASRLYARLREIIGNRVDTLVVVRADREVTLNKAVAVMDAAQSAGAGKLCLATEKGRYRP